MKISVIVPLYNEAGNIPALTERLRRVVDQNPEWQWEIVYVNDGSTDESDWLFAGLSSNHRWLTVIDLSRNFGHQNAITAGMDHSSGDAVIVMDGDLQDPPEMIPKMIAAWQQGNDVVYATRTVRHGETWFKKFTAAAFYRLLKKLTDTPIPVDTGDFRLISRRVLDALQQMPERNRFVRGMVSWTGFSQISLPYERDQRLHGTTKFSLFKMLRFASNGILSFSKVPLDLIVSLGLLLSFGSFIGILFVLYETFVLKSTVRGWGSMMVAVLFMGGIQLICIGMVGEYVGRIFDEVRKRPSYIIRQIRSFPRIHYKSPRNVDDYETFSTIGDSK
jgi:polyisoprenyl-phosphate glycosyltransferase